MAKPSLQASTQGQQLAEQSLTMAGLTKKSLSEAVGCSRQPVTNFFKGVAIEQSLFVRLCDRLNLDWQIIAGLTASSIESANSRLSDRMPSVDVSPAFNPSTKNKGSHDPEIDRLVQHLRNTARASLHERCGTMRVLDMSRPVGLSDLYTNVNILETVSNHQRKQLKDLVAAVHADAGASDFNRLGFGPVSQPRVPVMTAVAKYQKLIVLGKPGAGKTTFLKHLAMQCIDGEFETDRLPLFVNLKQFAENPNRLGLLTFMSQRHLKSQITALDQAEIDRHVVQLKQLLSAGRALVLLDGLDEVTQAAHDWVLRDIRVLSEEFHDNHFLMTCRVAAWEYTFEQFTEVEIADFDATQVQAFAQQWFADKPMQPQIFMRCLAQQPHLAELAVTPLLLTLLCLAFESSGALPSSRSELYREGIETLLKKWDASRGIHRDQVYKRLSPQRKEDLLSQIALATFRRGKYFFRRQDLEQTIAEYIRNLPEATDEPAALSVDSGRVLHSIEAQHGLLVERAKHYYSFSHLTFQEYFVARELVFNSANLANTLSTTVNRYALNPQWREVLLLIGELLRDADLLLAPLLDKAQTILEPSSKLQAFLADVVEQSKLPHFTAFKPAAVRAFLFDIDFDIDENRAVAIRLDPSATVLVCASFLARMLEGMGLADAIAHTQSHDASQQLASASNANGAMMIAIDMVLDSPRLTQQETQKLTDLVHRLDAPVKEAFAAKDEAIKEVADAARNVAKGRHHIGQTWTFTETEKQLLKQYYRLTRLIVDCLYSEGVMLDPQRRRAIEQTLFTPVDAV
ncbi:MAG: NACHT domain-containing protein [Cyanobacteria bacterium J06643_4]